MLLQRLKDPELLVERKEITHHARESAKEMYDGRTQEELLQFDEMDFRV